MQLNLAFYFINQVCLCLISTFPIRIWMRQFALQNADIYRNPTLGPGFYWEVPAFYQLLGPRGVAVFDRFKSCIYIISQHKQSNLATFRSHANYIKTRIEFLYLPDSNEIMGLYKFHFYEALKKLKLFILANNIKGLHT